MNDDSPHDDSRYDGQALAEPFAASRARLVRIAYAILGSYSEAEDVVAARSMSGRGFPNH